jgi:hypothetical protein
MYKVGNFGIPPIKIQITLYFSLNTRLNPRSPSGNKHIVSNHQGLSSNLCVYSGQNYALDKLRLNGFIAGYVENLCLLLYRS